VERRQFLMSTGAAIATQLLAGQAMLGGQMTTGVTECTFMFGVPLRSGSLLPGNENDAQAYRDVHLPARLQAARCKVIDDRDVAIPSYLPHHSIPPIGNWPGPRIVWDCVSERITPVLPRSGQVPLLIGCDCSVVVATTQALLHASSPEIHVPYIDYIDGDFDDSPPDGRRSQSAASCAVWLLTNNSPFWAGPAHRPSQASVIGWTNASLAGRHSACEATRGCAAGARPVDILRMVLRQSFVLVAIGIGIGLLASIGLTRVLQGLLFGIKATDSLAFAVVVAILMISALLACLLAEHAANADPVVALRMEYRSTPFPRVAAPE
jgi:hypothetical protein